MDSDKIISDELLYERLRSKGYSKREAERMAGRLHNRKRKKKRKRSKGVTIADY